MNKPAMRQEDKAITVNKSLAWTILLALIGGGYWAGSELSTLKRDVQSIVAAQEARQKDTAAFRANTTARVTSLEVTRAGDGVELSALRREMSELRTDLKSVQSLLQALNQSLGR